MLSKKSTCIFILLSISVQIFAETNQYTSKDLGIKNTILTPLGAQRSGNKDNSIPPWTGGITKWPKNYKPGDHHPCPFPQDKKLFTINSTNYQKFKEKLTEGMIALFKNYPKTFFMNIYPTHRTASLPNWVYEAIIENSLKAKIVENGSGIRYARVSSPFPIPRNGLEAIWNHLLAFKGVCYHKKSVQAAPTKKGSYRLIKMEETAYVNYSSRNQSIDEIYENNIYAFFLQKILSPPHLAGNGLLIY